MHPSTQGVVNSFPWPVKLRFLGSQLLLNGGGATSWDFSAFNGGGDSLGSETQKKQIVVCVYTVSGALSNIANAVTVAGVATTSVASTANPAVNIHLSTWKASISATSGTINVATGAGVIHTFIAVYEVLNANTTVFDVDFATATGTTMTLNPTTKAGGCIIAQSMIQSAVAQTFAWTGATKAADSSYSSTYGASFAYTEQTFTGSTAVSVLTNGLGSTHDHLVTVSFQPLQ